MYVCTFHGSIFLFCAYRVFFHWPTHFKDWKSFVVLHCELLCFKSLIGQTIYFHSCTFSMAKMYNSKYWYFVMSSWFWAWCKHMREVGRNHVGKGKFMISGWCTWNHLILQHTFLMKMIKTTSDFLSICATKTRWRDEKLFAMSSFHVQGSSSWIHEVWHLSVNKLH